MKSLLPTLLCLVSCLATARAGTPAPHFSVAFSATVTTSVLTSSNSAVFKVTKFNNATIFNQLAASGSFPGVTAADMAIVLNEGGSSSDVLDVINKNTHAILLPLIVSGSDSPLDATVVAGNMSKTSVFVDLSELVNLPNGTQFPTNTLLRVVGINGSNGLAFFSLSFAGGNNDNAILQGTVRKQTKVYTY